MKCETLTAKKNPCVSVDSGVVTDANKAFSELTGFSSADVCQKRIEDVLTSILGIRRQVYERLMRSREETCYLFTKTILPREVVLSIVPRGGSAYELEVTEKTGFDPNIAEILPDKVLPNYS